MSITRARVTALVIEHRSLLRLAVLAVLFLLGACQPGDGGGADGGDGY